MSCKFCGNTNRAELIDIRGYDWDSDDDTALSIMRTVGHRCENGSECALRAIETGNPEGLHEIIRIGYEHLSREIVNEAKRQIHQFAEFARDQAHAADLAARESGYGAIGSL